MTVDKILPDPTFAEPIRISSHPGSDTYWVLLTECSRSYGMEVHVNERKSGPSIVVKRVITNYGNDFDIHMAKEMDYLEKYFRIAPAKDIVKFLNARRKVLTEVYFGF